jgi:hypothetical protein
MTGLLTCDLLRTHEASFEIHPDVAVDRPRLIAEWTAGPDGRPVCRWKADDNPRGSGPH